MFDAHIDMNHILASHHRNHQKYIQPNNAILDPAIVDAYREKVCIGETAILKTLKYNLTFDRPYAFLDDICRKYFKDSNREIYYIARMALLDAFTCGASLFYKHENLVVASVIVAMKLKCNCLTPKHLGRQIAMASTGPYTPTPWSGGEITPSGVGDACHKTVDAPVTPGGDEHFHLEPSRSHEDLNPTARVSKAASINAIADELENHNKLANHSHPEGTMEGNLEKLPQTAPALNEGQNIEAGSQIQNGNHQDNENINTSVTAANILPAPNDSLAEQSSKLQASVTANGAQDASQGMVNELAQKQEEVLPSSAIEPEPTQQQPKPDEKPRVPGLFPMGLVMKEIGTVLHAVDIDVNKNHDDEGEILFHRWIQELDNKNINVEHVFGKLGFNYRSTFSNARHFEPLKLINTK
jgi:hypothetical protein